MAHSPFFDDTKPRGIVSMETRVSSITSCGAHKCLSKSLLKKHCSLLNLGFAYSSLNIPTFCWLLRLESPHPFHSGLALESKCFGDCCWHLSLFLLFSKWQPFCDGHPWYSLQIPNAPTNRKTLETPLLSGHPN